MVPFGEDSSCRLTLLMLVSVIGNGVVSAQTLQGNTTQHDTSDNARNGVDQVSDASSQPLASFQPSLDNELVNPWGSAARQSTRFNDSVRFMSVTPGSKELQLGLQFTIPFLNIPLKSLFGNFNGPPSSSDVDFSFQGLLTSLQRGLPVLLLVGVLAGTMFIGVPLIMSAVGGRGFPPSLADFGFNRRFGSDTDDQGGRALGLLQRLEDAFQTTNISPEHCFKQLVCRYRQTANQAVYHGSATSTQLIVEGLASNVLLGSWLEGSSVSEAMEAARLKTSCDKSFPKCSLRSERLAMLLSRYLTAIV